MILLLLLLNNEAAAEHAVIVVQHGRLSPRRSTHGLIADYAHPVSYTHLDVYKRQELLFEKALHCFTLLI